MLHLLAVEALAEVVLAEVVLEEDYLLLVQVDLFLQAEESPLLEEVLTTRHS